MANRDKVRRVSRGCFVDYGVFSDAERKLFDENMVSYNYPMDEQFNDNQSFSLSFRLIIPIFNKFIGKEKDGCWDCDIERGLSKVGIARVLRRWFKEYTVSEIYNDYELIKEAKETWRRMRYIRRDRRISEKFYKASYKRLKNRYLTTFELDIINLDIFKSNTFQYILALS